MSIFDSVGRILSGVHIGSGGVGPFGGSGGAYGVPKMPGTYGGGPFGGSYGPGRTIPPGVALASSINNPGSALGRLLHGAGDRIGGAVDYLTDKDQGANRIALLMGLANLGTGLYAAHEQGKREDQQYEQSQEDRQRRLDLQKRYAPDQQAILDMLMKQYKGNVGA